MLSFCQVFVKLAGNQDRHKIWDEFEVHLDQTYPLNKWSSLPCLEC